MYSPPFNRVEDEAQIRSLVAQVHTAWLVTTRDGGVPEATLLPIIWREETVIAHMAIANSHWRAMTPDMPVLLIVTGPDAYISPSWYAAKAEHGKVVPTWNYSAVHLSGTVQVRQDAAWLRAAVTDLTDLHESDRADPWGVADAPESYIDAQLRGIVGLEIAVHRVEGKAKLSQNRSDADQAGVIAGLDEQPDPGAAGVAAAMAARLHANG